MGRSIGRDLNNLTPEQFRAEQESVAQWMLGEFNKYLKGLGLKPSVIGHADPETLMWHWYSMFSRVSTDRATKQAVEFRMFVGVCSHLAGTQSFYYDKVIPHQFSEHFRREELERIVGDYRDAGWRIGIGRDGNGFEEVRFRSPLAKGVWWHSGTFCFGRINILKLAIMAKAYDLCVWDDVWC